MSFLGPVFLWALPLIAIPIAIHLLHRRQKDLIRWGAMQFLMEAQSRRRKFRRLEDLFLMLLRAGAVLAIILIPIALSGAVWGVGSLAEEKSKKISDKLKALTSQAPKGKGYRDILGEQKDELQIQKNRVWDAAYKAQDGLIRWPRALGHLNDLMTSPNSTTPVTSSPVKRKCSRRASPSRCCSASESVQPTAA